MIDLLQPNASPGVGLEDEDVVEFSLPMRNITNMNSSPAKSAKPTSPVSGGSLRFHCNQKVSRPTAQGCLMCSV